MRLKMDIRVEYLSTSKTILFAGSELKYYLSKINNTISFSQDTEQTDETYRKKTIPRTLS